MSKELLKLDHILYGGPNLNDLTEFVHQSLGAKSQYGGGHPQLGTHNSLLRLDDETYLELISPDPENKISGGVKILGIGDLTQPKVVGWAMQTKNIEDLRTHLEEAGFKTLEISEGQRNKPDGQLVKYKALFLSDSDFETAPMLEPFFIEWITDSPALTAPGNCKLVGWKALHPEPKKYTKLFQVLGFDFEIAVGEYAELQLEVQCDGSKLSLR